MKKKIGNYPNPDIETRIRVQSIGAYSKYKIYVATSLMVRLFLDLLGALKGCAINVFSISGIGNNMKLMKFTLISLFLMSTISYAELTAKVDRNQIVIGETFNLVITVDENTSEQPDLSELAQAFQVLGTSQSSSTKIINGSYSVEKTWNVSLMPNGLGEKTIPSIKLGNQSTQPIKVSVSKLDPNAKSNGEIFIEVSADKKSAFVKEQIILTVKLFYAVALSEGNLSEPLAKNTIVTQLDKGTTYNTSRDGKNYTVVEKHFALFAEKSGQLDLNPIIFNGRDNTSRRNFSMFSTGKPVRAVSKPLSIDIKPIPQTSIGKDWIPASNVQVSQQWTQPPYKVGEPITRTITLFIEGLSETQIPNIDLGEIENIRVYPEQPQTQTEKTAQTIKAVKQMKIALIPTQEGSIRIPEYQLEWYNTETNQIELAKLPPISLQVDAGDFGVKQQDVADMFSPEKQKQKPSSSASQVTTPQKVIQVIEKDNMLWKALTALFAILWLLTTWLYIKKRIKKSKNQVADPIVNISKKQIIAAINNKDIKALQSSLIDWWNIQYPDNQVTNLSQIKLCLNSSMHTLIDQVELYLYNPGKLENFNQKAWLQAVNSNDLSLIKSARVKSKMTLSKLY
jgi:hypothetical protein